MRVEAFWNNEMTFVKTKQIIKNKETLRQKQKKRVLCNNISSQIKAVVQAKEIMFLLKNSENTTKQMEG